MVFHFLHLGYTHCNIIIGGKREKNADRKRETDVKRWKTEVIELEKKESECACVCVHACV